MRTLQYDSEHVTGPAASVADTTNEGKEGRKEMYYSTTHSTHFYLRLYGVGHMVKEHSDSERGNPLPPHGLLFSTGRKSTFICTIQQTG